MMRLRSFALLFLIIIIGFSANSQSQTFRKYEVLEFDTENLWNETISKRSGESLKLEIKGIEMDLNVSNLLSANYKSVDQNGHSIGSESIRPIPYNGYAKDGSRVALTIGRNFLYGFIENEKRSLYIEPLRYYAENAKQDQFILYDSRDVIDKGPKTCGYTEALHIKTELENQAETRSVGQCYEVEYAICNDYSMVVKYGSAAGAEANAISVTNNVNTDYDDSFADEIRLVISGQYTSTCSNCDPWSSTTNSGDLLSSFRTWANANLANSPISIPHDVASLWTNRDFDGSTIGVAYRPGTCNGSYRYNILQDFSSNASLIRVLTSHELGHNFNAQHDASGSSFIMAPSVGNTTDWSSTSITAINAWVNGLSCLSACSDQPPIVQFENEGSSFTESSGNNSAGPCPEFYEEILIPVTLSKAPIGNLSLNISIQQSSTADSGYDFDLVTNSLTFTPGGGLSQNVVVRIFDDKIQETHEDIDLSLSINSGDAILGPFQDYTVTINDQDEVSAQCCSSDGGTYDYGSFQYALLSIFRGEYSDTKSRFIFTQNQLAGTGLTAGTIEELSFYVYEKNSTGSFQDFTISLAQTSYSELQSTPILATQQVYSADHSTFIGWNDFQLDVPFVWDGSSNLYMEVCFNNSSAVGNDRIIGHDAMINGTMDIQLFYSNSGNGCDLTGGNYRFYTDYHPLVRFKKQGGALVETTQNSSSNARIRSGEMAHLYSGNGRIIASIDNMGNTDLECIDLTLFTAGNGKTNLPGSNFDRTDKQFYIDADNNSYYKIYLYFESDELSTWGNNSELLNIVKSDVPLENSSPSNRKVYYRSGIQNNVGGSNDVVYSATVSGSGYFALTDDHDFVDRAHSDNGDLVFNEMDRGLIFKTSDGNHFQLTVNSAGEPIVQSTTPGQEKARLEDTDFYNQLSTNGLIFRRNGSGWTKLTVDNQGNISTSNINSLPTQRLELNEGDLSLDKFNSGVVLKNSQGECWKLFVDEMGEISTVQIPCTL